MKVGEPIGTFYGAEFAGADPDNGDALYYINAEGGDPNATTNDFTEANYIVLGSPLPTMIGGIGNTFSWGGLTLDVRFQGQNGNKIYNSGGIFMSCNACWFDNQTKDQLDRWQQPGDITEVPEARLGISNGDNGRSSRYVSDGSFLRLKNVTLAYDFGQGMQSHPVQLARQSGRLFSYDHAVEPQEGIRSDALAIALVTNKYPGGVSTCTSIAGR